MIDLHYYNSSISYPDRFDYVNIPELDALLKAERESLLIVKDQPNSWKSFVATPY